MAASPLGFIAIELGWVVTEVGRQPWIVSGVMRTAQGVTPVPHLWVPLVAVAIVYSFLAAVTLGSLRRLVLSAADSATARAKKGRGRMFDYSSIVAALGAGGA